MCRRKSRLLKTGTPDKHVDVCVESDEDRGSTPLASSPESFRGCHPAVAPLRDYGLAGQPISSNHHYLHLALGLGVLARKNAKKAPDSEDCLECDVHFCYVL